ncbi:hypothetical protein ACFY8S_01695 [Streptomyces hygroscopicus]|uniref:hypothetical protein n=1 Tax=Streptomyces hygroscopicus TaxID=1912 RepID=UPI0036B60DCE
MTALVETITYRATVTDYDCTTSVQDLTTSEADALIAAALFSENEVAIAPDWSGRITITCAVTGPRSATDPASVTVKRVTVLEPVHVPRLSKRQYADLVLIREREWMATFTDSGRVGCGLRGSVPPAATARLIERGWILLTPGAPSSPSAPSVAVSYGGRLAMALYEHRTAGNGLVTFDPDFSVHSQAGVYVASCACGWRGPGNSDQVAFTRGQARAHREEQVRAAFTA